MIPQQSRSHFAVSSEATRMQTHRHRLFTKVSLIGQAFARHTEFALYISKHPLITGRSRSSINTSVVKRQANFTMGKSAAGRCLTWRRAPFSVTGRDGQTMKQKFEPYAETYLSLATDGFPNYFMMLGPNAAVGTGTLTTMVEMTGEYIIKRVRKLQKENIKSMEVQKRRVRDFSDFIDHYFKKTVYMDNCSSWYRSKGGRGDRITGL